MSMDRNYVRNKIAFEVLKQINIHSPSNAYSELRINNESEGLYLVFYPPDDYAIKILNSPFVIRRGYGETIDKVYTEENMNRETLKDLKRKYMSLYSAATLNKNGQELYNDISAVLDVDSYFGWLAFNHLFQNGDYADEVYLMWHSDKSKFEVVPWDFDDILKEQPHEGIAERQKMLVDKLVFSLEDKLDKKIAGDSFVYSKYLERYALLLQTLTPEKLEDILVNVYDEVYPYFLHPDIVAQSKYDQYGATDMDKLQGDLNSIYQYISLRSRDVVQHVKTASH
jgi:spore coat protein H